MQADILEAYEYLTPKYQLIIDSVIIALYTQDKQCSDMAREMMEFLSGEDIQEKERRETN